MSHAQRRSAWPLPFILALALGPGCGGPPPGPAPLRVAAASDLQQALPVLAEQFTAKHGVEVVCVFGSSGQLADQIRAGAPFDVYLSANRRYVEELASEKLVRPGSVRPYAQGSLVLVVFRDAKIEVGGLADLSGPEVGKIAMANPDFAPYGAAARQALTRAGLWDSLGPKLVRAETVRQALQFVQSGNAEAGLVGRAIADVPEVRVVEVDPGLYDPIVQALGVVSATSRADDAEAFAQFLLGDEGQALLAKYGFARADGAGGG